ncbi:MAG: hypothetical protein OXR62_17040 [Ahrensia sp.]|nr:hypothetical protein [Ahrensia sp.]
MIGVDTGLIVALFLKEDDERHEAAKTLFRSARNHGGLFVSATALLEAVWTLKALHGYDDAAMKRLTLSLCSLPGVVVEHMEAVFAYATDADHNVPLSASLIDAANRSAGCSHTERLE